MDGNARMSKNEKGGENKDRNSGRCPETRQLVKTEEKEDVVDAEEESVSVAQCIPSSSETQQSDMDGWPFRKPKDMNDGTMSPKIVQIDVDRNAENYNMYHKRRGVALIFNNVYYTKMSIRKGSEKDCKDLAQSLQNLDFEVRIYEDPTLETILTTLRNTSAEDHTDADCLIVTVMSHGDSNALHSADSVYSADMLWIPFTADQCTTLAGKPKLFFIQACRGDQLDNGVIVQQSGYVDVTDSRTADSYSIPTFSDIMVAYSTQDGFYSWRNPDNGSWFIQAICEEFNIHGRTLDLLTLMTFVNRRVAINYQSFVPERKSFHKKKQIPTIVSMLTRIVRFPKKSILRSKPMIDSATEENKTSNIEKKTYGTMPC
ncbi:caspase-1-like [Vespa crabro]|uniref:caspase-1-like n=1 Tax=Vespa crabro TaxID=7445 RepID=UPI001F0057E0|nr:caspase-1-like [Vespa crabro]